jgi:hypothetical protein
MQIISCPDCGHLMVFHHAASSGCTKESLSGCHASIKIEKDNFLECECNQNY